MPSGDSVDFAADVARLLRSEKDIDRRQFRRLARASHRDILAEGFELLRRLTTAGLQGSPDPIFRPRSAHSHLVLPGPNPAHPALAKRPAPSRLQLSLDVTLFFQDSSNNSYVTRGATSGVLSQTAGATVQYSDHTARADEIPEPVLFMQRGFRDMISSALGDFTRQSHCCSAGQK